MLVKALELYPVNFSLNSSTYSAQITRLLIKPWTDCVQIKRDREEVVRLIIKELHSVSLQRLLLVSSLQFGHHLFKKTENC